MLNSIAIAIAATDLTPSRIAFLEALTDSLTFYRRDQGIEVSVIADHRECLPSNTRSLGQIVDAGAFLGAGAQCGELHPWYREQILALAFSAQSRSEYTLFLVPGAFVIGELTQSALLPNGLARSSYEDSALHTDWYANARTMTQRNPASPYFGISALPAILSRELAHWALSLTALEGKMPSHADVLLAAVRSNMDWSAMSLYTVAAGDRLGRFHHNEWQSQQAPLMSQNALWSIEGLATYKPYKQIGLERGLLTFVKEEAIIERDDVFDRLYSCLF